MFNPYDEFPHAISKGRIEVIGDFKFKRALQERKIIKALWIHLQLQNNLNIIKCHLNTIETYMYLMTYQ